MYHINDLDYARNGTLAEAKCSNMFKLTQYLFVLNSPKQRGQTVKINLFRMAICFNSIEWLKKGMNKNRLLQISHLLHYSPV